MGRESFNGRSRNSQGKGEEGANPSKAGTSVRKLTAWPEQWQVRQWVINSSEPKPPKGRGHLISGSVNK